MWLHELSPNRSDFGADFIVLADDLVEFVEVAFVLFFLDQHSIGRFKKLNMVALEHL